MSYIDLIKDRARIEKKTIVLPESTDKRTLIAAAKVVEERIANIIMIGNEEKICTHVYGFIRHWRTAGAISSLARPRSLYGGDAHERSCRAHFSYVRNGPRDCQS